MKNASYDGSAGIRAGGPISWAVVRKVLAAILAPLALIPTSVAQEIYAESDAIFFSDTLPVSSLLDGLQGENFTPGEASFVHARAASGFRWKWLDVAAIVRYDYVTSYSPSASTIIFSERNNLDLPDGTFDLSLDINRAFAYGGRIGARHSFFDDRLSVGVFGSVLSTSQLLNGSTEGSLELLNNGADIAGVVQVDYVYDRDLIFDREVDAPSGIGVAFDIEAALQITEKLRADVKVEDLWSRIWWDDAPRTVLDATTDTVDRDDNGLLIVRPFLQGQNSFEDVTTRYSARTRASLNYQITERWSLSQDIFNLGDTFLTTSYVDFAIAKDLSVGAEVEWTTGGYGVSMSWKKLSLNLVTDDIEFDDANYLKASLSASFAF
ncbi:MAG: hypothetical protein AAF292_00840 [Pseudomonadota bacterium]